MAGILQHLRSSTLDKRPNPGSMVDGQVAINYASGSPGLFFKDSAGALVKVGPVHVGSTAPNVSPASGGTAGNTRGEQWLDTSGGSYVMKIWDGSAWRTEAGEFVNTTGDIMTGALGMPPASSGSPTIYFSGDTDTGLYSPGANQLAISTGGTGRLFVDANGNVGIGINSSIAKLITQGTVGIVDSAAANTNLLLTADTGAAAGATVDLSFLSGGHGPLKIKTGGTEKVRITSDGKVGIGESSPLTKLDVRNGVITAGSNSSPSGSEILRGYYSNTDGALAVIGTEYSTGGIVIGFAVKPSTSTSDAFLSSTPLIAARGAYTIASNTHKWYIGNTQTVAENGSVSTSEVMRIDSSGRLLVGTSSAFTSTNPVSLQVAGGGVGIGTYVGATAGTYTLEFLKSRSSTVGGTAIVAASDNLGQISFNGTDGTQAVLAATIKAEVDGTPGANDMPGRLVFSTTADGASSPTERMRITNGGAFKASTNGSYNEATVAYHEFYQSADARTLYVRNINASLANPIFNIYADRNTSNGTYNFIEAGIQGTANRFIVADSGNVTNTNNSYGAISDAKLKDDIVDASSQWDDIKGLQVRKYKFKEKTGQPTHTQIGVVAQEVELVSPGLVGESIDRDAEGNDLGTVTKSVNYSVLYMKAVKALQEAMERIETLEAKVAALESA